MEYKREDTHICRRGPEEGEGPSGIDGYDGEVEGGVGAEDGQEGGEKVLHHLGRPLPEKNTLAKNICRNSSTTLST